MSDDPKTPDDSRWKRPEQHSEERFPALPDETPPAPRKPQRAVSDHEANARDRVRNLITIFFLLATVVVLVYFVILWQNPYSSLNPLAPPTPLPVMITATLTPTLTLTPSPTLTPTQTLTPSEIPSAAPTLTATPIFVQGFSTPPGTPPGTEDTSNYRFALKPARVLYLANPSARGGCNWSSIAGSVTDYSGAALNGYGVHVFGNGVDETVGTGTAPGMGPGGFEVPLGNVALAAQYVAQLVDPQGTLVSPVYTVPTLSDCNYNIAILRFVETTPGS